MTSQVMSPKESEKALAGGVGHVASDETFICHANRAEMGRVPTYPRLNDSFYIVSSLECFDESHGSRSVFSFLRRTWSCPHVAKPSDAMLGSALLSLYE